jgi:hypothetical protein
MESAKKLNGSYWVNQSFGRGDDRPGSRLHAPQRGAGVVATDKLKAVWQFFWEEFCHDIIMHRFKLAAKSHIVNLGMD